MLLILQLKGLFNSSSLKRKGIKTELDGIKEHIPKWYLENKKKTGASSTITKHLLTCTTPPADPRNAFKITRKARSDNELKISEVLFIKRMKPLLCVQKEYVISLCLDF